MNSILSWLKARTPEQIRWLERGAWALALVVFCLIARCTVPEPLPVEAKLVEVEKKVFVEDTQKLEKAEEKIRELNEQVAFWKSNMTKKTTTIRRPAPQPVPREGELIIACPMPDTKPTPMEEIVIEEISLESSGGLVNKTDKTTNKSAEVTTNTKTREETEREKQLLLKTDRPERDWHVGVLIGAQVPAPTLPIAGPLVVGAIGQRRIFTLGGKVDVNAGGWFLTSLAGGGVVSASF